MAQRQSAFAIRRARCLDVAPTHVWGRVEACSYRNVDRKQRTSRRLADAHRHESTTQSGILFGKANVASAHPIFRERDIAETDVKHRRNRCTESDVKRGGTKRVPSPEGPSLDEASTARGTMPTAFVPSGTA